MQPMIKKKTKKQEDGNAMKYDRESEEENEHGKWSGSCD